MTDAQFGTIIVALVVTAAIIVWNGLCFDIANARRHREIMARLDKWEQDQKRK
jgi:hypothetical protein